MAPEMERPHLQKRRYVGKVVQQVKVGTRKIEKRMERLYKGRYRGDKTDKKRRARLSAMEGKVLHRQPHINKNKARKEEVGWTVLQITDVGCFQGPIIIFKYRQIEYSH